MRWWLPLSKKIASRKGAKTQRKDKFNGKTQTERMEGMAREYAAVTGDWIVYVPEFDGNRDALEDGTDLEPITLEIKPMTVRENQRQSGDVRAKPGHSGIKTNTVEIQQKRFLTHVRNIQNLKVGGRLVTTAEELLETGLSGLVTEVEAAITDISRLDEGDVKNCRSRSVGTGKPSDGTA
jgi:hypothetical protein